MIKFFSRKYKITVACLVLLLCMQVLFAYYNFSAGHKISVENEIISNEDLFTHTYNNILSTLKEIDSFQAFLNSSGLASYVNDQWNLQDAAEAKKAADELNRRIDNTNISHEKIDKIYLLGENQNQTGFSKKIGSSTYTPSSQLTSIYDLNITKVLNDLIKNDSIPVFIKKGELTSKFNRKANTITKEQKDNVLRFLEELENNIVVCSMRDNTLLVSVLNPKNFENILKANDQRQGYFTFTDKNNNIIFNEIPSRELINMILADIDSDKVKKEIKLPGISYKENKEVLSPFGFKLSYIYSVQKMSKSEMNLLKSYGIIIFISFIVSFFFAVFISGVIMNPLSKMALAIRQQLVPISIDKPGKKPYIQKLFKSISIQNKIFVLLLFVTILPVLTSGILDTQLLYNFSKEEIVKRMGIKDRQMSIDLGYLKNQYEILINQLAVDDKIQENLKSPLEGKKIYGELELKQWISGLVLKYLSFSNISYFVLFDSNGLAKYSTTFSNNLDTFQLDLNNSKMIDNNWQVLWLTDQVDIYNKPAVTLVKRITYSSENSTSNMTGYLEFILKENAFQVTDLNKKTDYVILNENNEAIYSSSSNSEYLTTASILKDNLKTEPNSKVWIKKVDGSKQIILNQKIERTNWDLFVFNSFDSILAQNNELLYKNLLYVLLASLIAFIIARVLSGYLVKYLKKLKNSMKAVGEGNFEEKVDYDSKDEIGELVHNFNQMIDRLNSLMEENLSKQKREQELIVLQAKTELGMLQQQINPHFLYNTLEAINMRSRRYGALDISEMVNALVKIFRFSMSIGDTIVPVKLEIEHIKNYLLIQEIRFPGKFATEWSIDKDILSCNILKFILQPIVENAINHGISDYLSGGIIVIKAGIVEHMVQLDITDNGVGMEDGQLSNLIYSIENPLKGEGNKEKDKYKGIGLNNVYQRLKMHYKGKATMEIKSTFMGGTKITIRIPNDDY